jgi:23S rRNA U2552 (ribose-2'-O)-methylase RlmE/FtsJ
LAEARRCREALTRLKNRIEMTPRWDFYKSFGNRYEKIYTLGSCVHVGPGESKAPASRAFFKLWEIVCDNWDVFEDVIASPRPRRFAYVAEGPGSFVEAVVTMRARCRAKAECKAESKAKAKAESEAEVSEDAHTGMSLRSGGYAVPVWRLGRRWLQRHRVDISHGADGTGDVYALANLDAFVRDAGGPGSCDMVTGDGGFDFSSDFNAQEASMVPMLVSEALCCLTLLRPGGAAVVKVFDAFDADTAALLRAMSAAFEVVRLVKPRASRPANSERYLACAGFADTAAAAAAAAALAAELRAWMGRRRAPGPALRAPDDALAAAVARALGGASPDFDARLCALNVLYARRQIRRIEETLALTPLCNDGGLRREQAEFADAWRAAYMRDFPPSRLPPRSVAGELRADQLDLAQRGHVVAHHQRVAVLEVELHGVAEVGAAREDDHVL